MRHNLRSVTLASLVACYGLPGPLQAQSISELEARVADLQARLSAAEQDLQAARHAESLAREESDVLRAELQRNREANAGFAIGPLTIGGALRVNYVYGSYEGYDNGPSRAGHGGNIELDTFRINMALEQGPFIGQLEYRWYPAGSGQNYNFLHTGWLGYRLSPQSHVEAGVNRVPFGAGPYGISQSYFFDQHYYVGLADDPDLGLKYSYAGNNYAFDAAYYVHNEPSFSGRSADSTRYGYDVVRWRESIDSEGNVNFGGPRNGFRESDQYNLRLIRYLRSSLGDTALGASLQYGGLEGTGVDDGEHWAASLHLVQNIGDLTIGLQTSRYEYHISADNPWQSDTLIPMGAYDFAWPVAAKAWVPAVSISYKMRTPGIAWLDSIRPYLEWSSIVKDEERFNDSQLAVIGAALARGGWYIYSELAYSSGNYFIGNRGDDYTRIDTVNDFGISGNNRWDYRFNINLGYYY
ncbi:carbohydrate porin [Parahaliea mediterranea]|uniref:carbohydrate porin n=1 Tax=Parahaliea mediterranea TaxID=651086 RepID=UPI000E2E8D5C|nr:carbohydrate porin [Parahaliea mediterranea]